MTRNQKKYLFDILQSMEDIKNVHLKGIINEQDFIEDLKTIRAVERELAIIGEAAHQLQKLKVNFIGQDQIINKRNTLVHQYDAARPSNLWNYIRYKLPEIEKEVSRLLK